MDGAAAGARKGNPRKCGEPSPGPRRDVSAYWRAKGSWDRAATRKPIDPWTHPRAAAARWLTAGQESSNRWASPIGTGAGRPRAARIRRTGWGILARAPGNHRQAKRAWKSRDSAGIEACGLRKATGWEIGLLQRGVADREARLESRTRKGLRRPMGENAHGLNDKRDNANPGTMHREDNPCETSGKAPPAGNKISLGKTPPRPSTRCI